MLKARIMTGILLITAVVLGLFFAPLPWVAVALSAIALICGFEWLRLVRVHSKFAQFIFYAGLLLGFVGIMISSVFASSLLIVAAGFWLIALAWVSAYQKGTCYWPSQITVNLLIGWVLILPMWAGIYTLVAADVYLGRALTLLLLVMVWSSDIFAFFAGRAFGRHKLADKVSPGKSWQGVFGGVAGTLCVVALALALFFPQLKFAAFLGLTFVMVWVSVLGDLFESMVKRIHQVKDSGKLLPGHGGALDRLDSLTAAAPLFTLAYWVLGIGQ